MPEQRNESSAGHEEHFLEGHERLVKRMRDEKAAAFVDARCGCNDCEARTGNVYRMVGWCSNCGTEGIVVLYRAGDSVRDVDCPVCEHYYSVRQSSQRLATPDEVPSG